MITQLHLKKTDLVFLSKTILRAKPIAIFLLFHAMSLMRNISYNFDVF